ncbi:MAG: PLAT/LH2 domain-containing protein [Reichenbachiella sp.]
MELIKEFGLIAGVAGLGIGVLLFLFKNLLGKIIFPKMSKNQSFKIILFFMAFVWSIAVYSIHVYSQQTNIEAITVHPGKEIETVKEECDLEKYNYRIKTQTSSVKNAQTNNPVSIKIVGTKNETKWILLDNEGVNDFESGETNIFDIDSHVNIGNLKKVRMKLGRKVGSNSSHENDLILEKIEIIEVYCNKKTEFKTVNLQIGDNFGDKTEWMTRDVIISWI